MVSSRMPSEKEDFNMKNLGFGMMRLPVKNGDPTDFDYEQLTRILMV